MPQGGGLWVRGCSDSNLDEREQVRRLVNVDFQLRHVNLKPGTGPSRIRRWGFCLIILINLCCQNDQFFQGACVVIFATHYDIKTTDSIELMGWMGSIWPF